ncbi:zinc ribbon domain-containing protein [Mycobacterium sp. NPDC048908]|uniref:zinc ribbon domain-containing protein n=1 Tax=Mycobacterium sp. NPDC048908 TaxID=3364292 RepID=UPI00371EA1BB
MSTNDEQVPTEECRICKVDVPAGEYCGLCGCHLTPRPGEGPDWLRIRDFGAAPGEHLLQPSLSSSLFPHLPPKSRNVFRIGLALVLVALVAFAVLRMPGALVAVSALGFPLLFLLYLHESDGFNDLPARTWGLAAVVGIVLGVGWVLLTGMMVARSYGIGLDSGVAATRMLSTGIGIPLGGVLLMLAPVVLVRLLGPPTREALDGFMVGALGALSFTAAATLARLTPQFGSGVVSKRPMDSLLVEAGIRGVAVPLTAAAAGGLIGAALWFKRPPSKEKQRPGVVRALLVFFAVAVLAVYVGLGLIDVSHFPQVLMLVIYLVLAAAALFLLRLGLHLALLHEAHDEIQSDEPLLCPHCGHVVPDMAFCPACGVATRASSRSSRSARRNRRPVRSDNETGAT